MKKISSVLIAFLLIFASVFTSIGSVFADKKVVNLEAKSAVLIDYETGKVIYKKNGKEKIYQDFLDDKVNTDEYISDESVNINSIPDIPVYLGNFKKSADDELKIEEFSTMIDILINDFLDLNEDIYMDELFWHSYLCLYKRDYLLYKYPEIKEGFNKFKLVVMKDFDWENYLYKAVLEAKYIVESGEEANKDKYARLIMENLDIYN